MVQELTPLVRAELQKYMLSVVDRTMKDRKLDHLSTEQITDLFRDSVVSFFLKKAIKEKTEKK